MSQSPFRTQPHTSRPLLRAVDQGGQQHALACRSPGCCPKGWVCGITPWRPTSRSGQPSGCSSPALLPSMATLPVLPSSPLQTHGPDFPTPLRQFQPPGPPSTAKYSNPTSRCVGHHKPCLRKQETNISHSLSFLSSMRGKREVQVLMPLNWAESRRVHPATAKAQAILHFLNSTFSYSAASLSTTGACLPLAKGHCSPATSASDGRRVSFPEHPSAPRGGVVV